jgi:ABC-2 type transport system permease protein
VINPGLLLLIRMNQRGVLRAAWRRLRTLKGAVTALLVAPLVILVLGSQLFLLFLEPGQRMERPDPGLLRLIVPVVSVLLLLSEAWTGRALAFRPAELDFLFPAPVSRRELLAYHLLARLPMRVLSALWLALFTLRSAHHPLGAVLTPLLLFMLIHVSTELIALLGAASSAWAGPWRSRLAWGSVAAVVLWSGARAVRAAGGALAGIRAVLETPALRLVTWPMRPFGAMFAAGSPAGVLGWAAVAVAEIALVTALVFVLDVAYSERAVAVSRRALERLRVAGAGQARGVPRPWKLRVRFPMLRLLGTGAPLAWRQALELFRNPRALVLPFLLPALYVAMFMALPAIDGEPITPGLAAGAIGVAILVPLLMPNVGFDFRRDMDRVAMLRALPVRPAAVAAGQIFAPTLAFVAAELGVVAFVAFFSRAISPLWVFAALALGVPLTWAVVALDNLLFLWMPYRFTPDGTQNVQFAGKTMLVLMVKFFVLGVMGGLAALAGWGAHAMTHSGVAALAAAALVLAAGCAPLTWAVGAAFQGFDLASEVPS